MLPPDFAIKFNTEWCITSYQSSQIISYLLHHAEQCVLVPEAMLSSWTVGTMCLLLLLGRGQGQGIVEMFAGLSHIPPCTSHPMIAVAVSGNGTPTAGQSYTLTCSISGANNVNTYQWEKDDSVIQGETTEMLSFSSLRLSHAEQYTCEVILEGNMFSNTRAITLQSK